MENVIVAGIVDTRTGEIVETTVNPSAKVRLSLRARDELNAEHGKGTFAVFEFNSMGGMGNLDYLRRNLRTDNPDALKAVERLRARYNVADTERAMERVTAELTLTQSVRDECMAMYEQSGDAQKRAIVEDAFSDELDGLQDELNSLRYQRAQCLKSLRSLEETAQ